MRLKDIIDRIAMHQYGGYSLMNQKPHLQMLLIVGLVVVLSPCRTLYIRDRSGILRRGDDWR